MSRWSAKKGRVTVAVQVFPLGPDWCLLVTGGEAPHAGAVGWSGDIPAFSLDFPQHRDRVVVDLFLEALLQVPGKHIVVAGIHLEAITPQEIELTLQLCRTLASRVAASLGRAA